MIIKKPTNKQIQVLYCSLPKLLKSNMYNYKNMYVRSDIGEKIIRNYTIKKQKNMDRREREERVKQFKSNIRFKEDIII